MENGLHRFYETYSSFLVKLQQIKVFRFNMNDNVERIFTLELMHGTLIMYFYYNSLSFIIFLIEIIAFNVKKLYARRKKRVFIKARVKVIKKHFPQKYGN